MVIKNKKLNIFKKGPAQYRRRKPSGSGFVILFAATLSAILLSIALGVASIALKEIKFGTSAKDADNAFFAADTATEKTLYEDFFKGSYSPSPMTTTFNVSGLGSDGQSCAIVTVTKYVAPDRTNIISKGYNIGGGGGGCTKPSSAVERELETNY